MLRCIRVTATLAVCALVAPPLSAEAQSYRCVGKDGRKYYGQVLPRECIGKPYEQLNQQGTVIRHVDPNVREDDPAIKAAEAKKKREQELAAREEARRSRALLATYTSEKDIDDARKRTLDPITSQIANIEAGIAQLEKRIEAHNKKSAGPNKAGTTGPDIGTAQAELAAQQELLTAKKKEAEAINAKYDEDKKRYIELTRGK